MNAYAPTSGPEDDDDISRAIVDRESKLRPLQEMSMPKNGIITKEDFKGMEAFGIGETNKKGDHLTEFADEHKLIIANTLFQKPKDRYWTWESPDWETRNQIEFTLSDQQGTVTNSEVITKADIGSDHRLVRMTLRINKA